MVWTMVTGGAKGLGAEICRALACNGYDVILHYRQSQKDAEKVAQECVKNGVAVEVLQCDFSIPRELDAFINTIEKKGLKVQNLINNVGSFFQASSLETSLETWHALFQTNFFAPLALTLGLMPSIKLNQGSVVNIGSVGAGSLAADVKRTAYSLTKKNLYFFTKSLAKEVALDKVRVNMVSPGELENSLTLTSNFPMLPMGRPGSFEEVVRAVLFLLDEENSYITGQNIEVAGGFAL